MIPRGCAARRINAAHGAVAIRIGATGGSVRRQAALATDGHHEGWNANESGFTSADCVPAGFAAVRVDVLTDGGAALAITAASGVVGDPATSKRSITGAAHADWTDATDGCRADAERIPLAFTAECINIADGIAACPIRAIGRSVWGIATACEWIAAVVANHNGPRGACFVPSDLAAVVECGFSTHLAAAAGLVASNGGWMGDVATSVHRKQRQWINASRLR